MMEQMTSKDKGVVKEEIMDHDVNDVVGKEFDGERGKSVPTTMVREFKQDSLGFSNEVDFDDVDFEQGMEELLYYDTYDGSSISRKEGDLETWFSDKEEHRYLFAIYDPAINDEGDVVLVEVVVKEMVVEEVVTSEDDKQVVCNRDVIIDELYVGIVVQEGILSVDDGDVIPDEVEETCNLMIYQEQERCGL
ncbi:hypothetical protein Tco_1062970 [Tanacetum coccineum]